MATSRSKTAKLKVKLKPKRETIDREALVTMIWASYSEYGRMDEKDFRAAAEQIFQVIHDEVPF